MDSPLEEEWCWRTLGGELMLVTKAGGSKVVLCGNAGPMLTRSEDGRLEPITPEHPIARALAALPALVNGLRGVVGLTTLLRMRGDLPADVVNALAEGCIHENHRLTDARAALALLEAR